MTAFEECFSDDAIIHYLCRLRAKYAKQRSEMHLLHVLTKNEGFNYHKSSRLDADSYQGAILNDLNLLLPPRRKWKDLKERARSRTNHYGVRQRLSSPDKNVRSLHETIRHYWKHAPTEPFVIRLKEFIREVREEALSPAIKITAPSLYPKVKKATPTWKHKVGQKVECRPISLFTLKDRIILSITNKYLTKLFDAYLDDSVLAFRAPRPSEGQKHVITHHDALAIIQTYKGHQGEVPLWVAECDMKKFYDSVNHKVIDERFAHFVAKASSDNQGIDLTQPERIFRAYLACYCFNLSVLPLNKDPEYWSQHDVDGEFAWICKDLIRSAYYDHIDEERIGIPQGGALSGLIANIVLDSVDKLTAIDPSLLYIRYCDDMILMHPEKEVCDLAIQRYQAALRDLKLVPHDVTEILSERRGKANRKLPENTFRPFWDGKSKGPYPWGPAANGGYPWIGFVGYELKYDGAIRVRRSSLEKEIEKQNKVMRKIRAAIETQPRKPMGTIAESAIHRLIGMSVGRVELWNYQEVENEMCWKNGFRGLNENEYSARQLKQLDQNRNRLYYKLLKYLETREGDYDWSDTETSRKGRKSRPILTYDKPFSYYFQVIGRLKTGRVDTQEPTVPSPTETDRSG